MPTPTLEQHSMLNFIRKLFRRRARRAGGMIGCDIDIPPVEWKTDYPVFKMLVNESRIRQRSEVEPNAHIDS